MASDALKRILWDIVFYVAMFFPYCWIFGTPQGFVDWAYFSIGVLLGLTAGNIEQIIRNRNRNKEEGK